MDIVKTMRSEPIEVTEATETIVDFNIQSRTNGFTF